eukprot:TRINITY_DN9868_c0_g1_i2.p1 TRINITY_DN9868_c0_g1~~TRINITY_DN9868_c0_g1_i2.p1  ORF type:complete len:848 (+),score=139.92 TRINITY_DN9868_c0_g1_i2:71-2614(+)
MAPGTPTAPGPPRRQWGTAVLLQLACCLFVTGAGLWPSPEPDSEPRRRRDADWERQCLSRPGYRFDGLALDSGSPAATAAECAAACTAHQRCAAYSYRPQANGSAAAACVLLAAATAALVADGFTAGCCPRPGEPRDCAAVGGSLAAQGCAEEQGAWYEGTFLGGGKGASLQDCISSCRRTAQCKYVNFRFSDSECHRFSSRGGWHLDDGHVAADCTRAPPAALAGAPPPPPQVAPEDTAFTTATAALRGNAPEALLADLPFLARSPEQDTVLSEANADHRRKSAAAYSAGGAVEGREGLHLFFTTDCSRHSLWQALALEHSWAAARHPGALSRLASGCVRKDGTLHHNFPLFRRTSVDHPKLFVFFGPTIASDAVPGKSSLDCARIPNRAHAGLEQLRTVVAASSGACALHCRADQRCSDFNWVRDTATCELLAARGRAEVVHRIGTAAGTCTRTGTRHADYAPINRPSTAWYWMQTARPPEAVWGLLDPDMVFLRPLEYHIPQPARRGPAAWLGGSDTAPVVGAGRPVGQYYDYLVTQDWDKHYEAICKGCPPLGNKTDWSPGPPHLMAAADWEATAPWWLRYTVGARMKWGAWTSEMAGMSIALARLGLRSRLVTDGMWDRPTMAEDALRHHGLWQLDSVPAAAPAGWPEDPLAPLDRAWLPSLLHYCFTYELNRKVAGAESLRALMRPPKAEYPGARAQVRWEVNASGPLLSYIHWSKYRSMTDWPHQVASSQTVLDCQAPLLFEYPPLPYMVATHSGVDGERGWHVFIAATFPLINAALVEYRARHCTAPVVGQPTRAGASRRVLRTAHDGWWHSRWEMTPGSAPGGFNFTPVSDGYARVVA